MDKHLTNRAVHLWSFLETLNVVFAFIVSGAHSIDKHKYPLYSICIPAVSKCIYFSEAMFIYFFLLSCFSTTLSLSPQNRWLSHVSQLFCPSTSSPRSWRWELSPHRIQDSSEYIFHCPAAAVNGFCRIKVKQGIAEKCF